MAIGYSRRKIGSLIKPSPRTGRSKTGQAWLLHLPSLGAPSWAVWGISCIWLVFCSQKPASRKRPSQDFSKSKTSEMEILPKESNECTNSTLTAPLMKRNQIKCPTSLKWQMWKVLSKLRCLSSYFEWNPNRKFFSFYGIAFRPLWKGRTGGLGEKKKLRIYASAIQ